MVVERPVPNTPDIGLGQFQAPRRIGFQQADALYDNLDTMYAAHNAAKAIKRENAVKGMPVPLHPGAERYYREVGVIK